MTNETSQERLNRMILEAQRRMPVGKTMTRHGRVAVWNGSVWVYGKDR